MEIGLKISTIVGINLLYGSNNNIIRDGGKHFLFSLIQFDYILQHINDRTYPPEKYILYYDTRQTN